MGVSSILHASRVDLNPGDCSLSDWDQPVRFDDLFDWEKSTGMLAAQAP
jgi:hypothetical protein